MEKIGIFIDKRQDKIIYPKHINSGYTILSKNNIKDYFIYFGSPKLALQVSAKSKSSIESKLNQ